MYGFHHNVCFLFKIHDKIHQNTLKYIKIEKFLQVLYQLDVQGYGYDWTFTVCKNIYSKIDGNTISLQEYNLINEQQEQKSNDNNNEQEEQKNYVDEDDEKQIEFAPSNLERKTHTEIKATMFVLNNEYEFVYEIRPTPGNFFVFLCI